MNRRRFGSVFKSFDTISNDYVAIRVARTEDSDMETDITVLQSICSKYIVQCYDCEKHSHDYWVHVCAFDEVVDCNGVLPMWIPYGLHCE